MAYCLIPKLAEEFKQKLIDGTYKPEELIAMTSAERRALFAESLGEENAKNVNALFESKLLLKSQQQGMINWAKQVTGISKATQQDLIARIERLDKALTPEEEDKFLADLVAKRLGTEITYEEAGKIAELTKKISDGKIVIESGGDRMDYGHAVVELNNYMNEIKQEANKLTPSDFKKNPFASTGKVISNVLGTAKSLKASLDDSAIFRQGWKAMLTHPGLWFKNGVESFANLIKTFGEDNVMDELNADIASRPNAMNGYYKKSGLATGTLEEDFPTTLAERIPGLGKIYKASEVAYTAFVHKLRADVFDKYIDIANKTGVDLSDDELKSIGKLVNSLTGRGGLGSFEPVANIVNNVFFSPRATAATFQTFTQPFTGAGGSNFVRKQAAINILKIIAGTAVILATAKAIDDKSVDLDPRSADFGKIKVGDTRFDVSGGMSSVITLISRLITKSTKNTTTGVINPINAKDKNGKPSFGAETGVDIAVDFLSNKLSPGGTLFLDWLKGSDFQGNKLTIKGELNNMFTPLPIANYIELKNDPNSANKLVSMLADALGIATNTYAPTPSKKKK